MGRKRSFSCPPPTSDAGNRGVPPCGREQVRQEEEKAVKNVLRMLFRSPNLPAAYLDLARGMLLLATHSPSRDNSERVKAKAGWARELERDDLRHWAVKLFHRGARLRAWKAAGGAFPSLRAKCKQASPELRRTVLAQLHCVENPSQVCKDLGTVVDMLISELELAGEDVEEAPNNNAIGSKDDNDDLRPNTAGLAHGHQHISNGGTRSAEDSARCPTPDPALNPTMRTAVGNLQAMGRRVRSKSVGALTLARRYDSVVPNGPSLDVEGCGGWCHVQEGEASLQQSAGGAGQQHMTTNIQERCRGVLEKIELVASLVDDNTQGVYSPEAVEGTGNTTQDKKATMQGMQGILNGMSRTPAIHGDLHLEDDIFEAIKQLVAWKPPPKWKRDRSRYNAQLTRAAGVLLKKALIPEGPAAGFWPLVGARIPKKAPMLGVKVALFRRKKGLREAAGGGARSSGRTKHGVWSFSACSFRYASKPPILPSATTV